MATPLEPAERALLEHALARGFLTQVQVDQAVAAVAAAAAGGRPVQLLQVLRERYLDPACLPELAAVYRGERPPGQDSVTVLADPPPGPDESQTVLTAQAPQAPDARRIGPYEIVREIARGGMGVVYLARRPGQEANLALKLLLNSERAEPSEVERFKIEAAAAGKLSHPNVVKIHDLGQDARGCHFMVMDYIEGDSLQGVLRRRGVMNARRAAELTVKMARALQHAHDRRVLHRDMKPANVLLREGEPLIADFGLAKQQGASGKSLTVTGEVMGTPAYMPPEQAEGARKEVDARSDQYSLGATLYEMLTGQAPFTGQTAINVVMAVLSKPPLAPRKLRPDLDPELEAIVLKTLSKEREDRYPDCEALALALEEWLGKGAAPTGAKGPLVTLAALALLAIAGGAAFALRDRGEDATTPPPATATASDVVLPSAGPTSSDRPSPTPVVDYSPPPAPSVAYTPPALDPLFDEEDLERVVLLDAKSLDDPALEHLEVGHPWLLTRTPEGLRFRGNRNASPRLRLPLKSTPGKNARFMLRAKFRVQRLGKELHFGVNLSSQSRNPPRLLALAMATKATDRPDFRGVRLRYYPKPLPPNFAPPREELFSPQLLGFRPDRELTIEVRASEHELELTTLEGKQVLDRTRAARARFDSLQAQGLDLEVGFVQSNTVDERRSKGFSTFFNTGNALLISCELLAEPGTFTLDSPKAHAWRLLGRAGRALARGDLDRTGQLLADPLLSPAGIREDGVHVRAGVLRALLARARGDRQEAIRELRLLDAREQERFPTVGSRKADKERFVVGMGTSFWGLRTADLPLVDSDLRSLFIDAYRAHLQDPETDLAAFAEAQRRFFEQTDNSLPGLSEAFRAARAKDMAPLAALVRERVAKTLRRDDSWGLRHHLAAWLALNLSAAEPPFGSSQDTVAGYAWNLAGANALAWELLQPSLESKDPAQRWVAVNYGANARYRQGDHAGAYELWSALEAEGLEGPRRIRDSDEVDAGVYEVMRKRFEHARRMTGR